MCYNKNPMLNKNYLKAKKIAWYAGIGFLIFLYALTEYAVRRVYGSSGYFNIGDQRLPLVSLAGVFASMSTVVFISLVIFFRKPGYYLALAIIIFRILRLAVPLLNKQVPNMPGLFLTSVSLVSVILIYEGNERARRVQEEHRKSLEQYIHSITGALVNCIDGKDSYTNGHSARVANYTKMLAEKLGEKKSTAEEFYNIAILHDVGKIGIPDSILNKPGKLTEEEYAVMKNHAQRGYEILKDVTVQEGIAAGAHYHHERFDGKGYPDGISGCDIPWVARIIAVADTLDAMSSTRPYRKKLSMNCIVEEIKRCSGSQFDPLVVNAFLELYREGAFDSLKEMTDDGV